MMETERRMQQELRNRIDEKLETLRDQFAMAALTGFLSANEERATMDSPEHWASEAYEWADAMMKARNRVAD